MKKILWTLFYCLIFSILLHNSFSYLDPDFGWHLRFGQIIWDTKSLPHDQIFMWTLWGKTWVDHEWLSNLIIYLIWFVGGYISLSFIFAFLPLLTLFIINRHLFKNYSFNNLGVIVLVISELLLMLSALGHLGIRVQEITLLAVTLLIILLDRITHSKKKTPPWWLPLFFYLWACLHGGFLIGLVLLSIWVGLQIIMIYFPKLAPENTTPLPKQILKQWILISIISFIVTFLTPYGLSLYSFLGEYRDTFYQAHIKEWLSPYSFPLNYKQIIANLVIASSVASVYFALKKKTLLYNCVVVALLLIMAFKSVRHFPLLLVAWLLLIAPYYITSLTDRFKIIFSRLIIVTAVFCTLATTIHILVLTKLNKNPFNSYCNVYPCGTALFLQQHEEYYNHLLNPYNFGGYLIGVAPKIPLFIDGRLPQYSFNNHSILKEYLLIYQKDLVRKKLEEHEIKTVIYEKQKPPPRPNWFEHYILGYSRDRQIEQPLLAYISASPGWQKVFEDNVSLVYVKK